MRTALVAALFFLSGASALVYQVAWQRILALGSGAGLYSVATIVAAFMAGLGFGSLAGGLLSTRVSPGRALAAFALIELLIAGFGSLSCWLFYDQLYLGAPGLYTTPGRAALAHFLALLPPTCLMGMSLPFLARATVRDARTAGHTLGLLYGINMLGAGVGAALAPWVLMRQLGIEGAVAVAATGNLAAGLGALALAAVLPGAESDTPAADPTAPLRVSPQPFVLWLLLYALSGCCALSLEILWFRLLDVAVKSTAFTFGTVLAFYLGGSAVGSLLGARKATQLQRPLRAFLLCQILLLAYSGVVVTLLARLPVDLPVYDWFNEYWSRYEGFKPGPGADVGLFLRLYVLLPLALFGPPTVLMGFSFPILHRAVQNDPRTSGFKAGTLQAANIAGCVVGSLVVGLVSLRFLGTTGTLRVLLGAGLLFVLVGLRRDGSRLFAALGVCLALLLMALPGGDLLWARLHGMPGPPLLEMEDATGVVALVPQTEQRWVVFVNGKGNSEVPFTGVHTLLGAVPALIHPAPQDVAIIGLGSGNTAWAAACRNQTRTVTVFELAAPQPLLLDRLRLAHDPPKLRKFLDDPRIHLLIADGRHALERSGARYDFIEADALRPDSAGSGNLYSREFFEHCAAKLRPGGLMCTWAPTARIRRTFLSVFPYALEISGETALVGSRGPLSLEPAEWTQRASEVTSYLGGERVTQKVLAVLLQSRLAGASPTTDLDLDLYPRDELGVP